MSDGYVDRWTGSKLMVCGGEIEMKGTTKINGVLDMSEGGALKIDGLTEFENLTSDTITSTGDISASGKVDASEVVADDIAVSGDINTSGKVDASEVVAGDLTVSGNLTVAGDLIGKEFLSVSTAANGTRYFDVPVTEGRTIVKIYQDNGSGTSGYYGFSRWAAKFEDMNARSAGVSSYVVAPAGSNPSVGYSNTLQYAPDGYYYLTTDERRGPVVYTIEIDADRIGEWMRGDVKIFSQAYRDSVKFWYNFYISYHEEVVGQKSVKFKEISSDTSNLHHFGGVSVRYLP